MSFASVEVVSLARRCLPLTAVYSAVWVSPEQHGTLTAVFKNQIDWIPLSLGSVRPSQGRTLAVAQVRGPAQPSQSGGIYSARNLGAAL